MPLKTTSNASLICLLASYPFLNAFAYDGMTDTYAIKGATIGVGLGANVFMTDITNRNTLGTIASGNASNSIYQYGIMGNLLAGYGNVFNNGFYLGTELGLNFFEPHETALNYSSQTTSTNTGDGLAPDTTFNTLINSTTTVTRSQVEPTLDVKIGGLVNSNALLYLRGGINYNNLQIKSQSAYQTQATVTDVEPLSVSSLFTHSQSKRSIGLRAGAGMEYMATPNLGISANYIYTFYKSLNANASGTGNAVTCDLFEGCVINETPIEQLNNVHTNDQQVLVELIYHFG